MRIFILLLSLLLWACSDADVDNNSGTDGGAGDGHVVEVSFNQPDSEDREIAEDVTGEDPEASDAPLELGQPDADTDTRSEDLAVIDPDAAADTPSDPDPGGEDTEEPPARAFSVTIGPFAVGPYVEDTKCVIVRLGNDTDLLINEIENVLAATSHHFIIYRTSETEEIAEPFSCTPFLDTLNPSEGSPLMITQRAEERLILPDGIAFGIQADQMIRLELHYINLTDEETTVQATSTFRQIPEEEFEHEADFLFIGNPDVSIPANSTATLGPTYFPLSTTGFSEVNFWALTGHTHQWGTDVSVALADSADGPDTDIYNVPGWRWNEPETVYLSPPLQVPEGGGFRFTCEWDNRSDDSVGFGESANDEMCFFWAYYYPSQGPRVCVHTDQFGGYDLCCPGDLLCDLVLGFL